MNFFHNYPYTDFHELNLDWCIENVKKLLEYFEGLSALATIEYVDTEIAKAKAACEALIADLEERKLDKTTFNTFVSEVQQSLNSIVSDINVLERATAANTQAIIDTYNELKEDIDSQLIELEVINPLTIKNYRRNKGDLNKDANVRHPLFLDFKFLNSRFQL